MLESTRAIEEEHLALEDEVLELEQCEPDPPSAYLRPLLE
jgi:hypothetical protein